MTEMELANALRQFVIETAREHADEILASRTSEVPVEYQMLYEGLKNDMSDVYVSRDEISEMLDEVRAERKEADDSYVTENDLDELIFKYLENNDYKGGYELRDYVDDRVENYIDDYCNYVTDDDFDEKISDYIDNCDYITKDDVNYVVKDNIDSTVEDLVGMKIDEYVSTMLPSKDKFVTHDELDFRLGKRIDHQVLRCTLMNIENSIDSLIVELDKAIRGEE